MTTKLGICEICSKDVYQIPNSNNVKNPHKAAYIYLMNGVPVIKGDTGSSILSKDISYIKDMELYSSIEKKLNSDKDLNLYICDDCLIKYQNTKLLWFNSEDNAKSTAVNSDKYITIQRECRAYKYNDDKERLYEILSTDENFLHTIRNGISVDRNITKNPNNLLIISRIDNGQRGMEICEIKEDHVFIIYSNDDCEVLDEDEFNKRFKHVTE